MKTLDSFTIAGATPAVAGSALVTGASVLGFAKYDWFEVDAVITAGAGGTLDIYIQRKVASDVWLEVAHFPQVAAGATKYYSAKSMAGATITEVGKFNDAGAGTAVLAANTWVGGSLGDQIRVYATAGAGAAGAGAVTLYVRAFKDQA